MILGDATIGNTTVGFSTSKVDLSLSATATSAATLNTTLGKATSLSPTSTGDSIIFNRVDLSTNPTSNTTPTFNSSKGVLLTFGIFGEDVGDFSLGDGTLGYTRSSPPTSDSTLSGATSIGRPTSFSGQATSASTIFRKVNLALSSAASLTTDFASFKGKAVQVQSTATSTAVFIPEFDEIIGRTRADGTRDVVERADGERVFIIQAEGNID